MGGDHKLLRVLCPLCPFPDIERAYVIEDMVGTSGFEPLTSTRVKNPSICN
jgi:hypothetical protein